MLKAHKHDQNCLQTDLTMNQTIPFDFKTSMRIRSRGNPQNFPPLAKDIKKNDIFLTRAHTPEHILGTYNV